MWPPWGPVCVDGHHGWVGQPGVTGARPRGLQQSHVTWEGSSQPLCSSSQQPLWGEEVEESGCCWCHCLARRLSCESRSEVSSFVMVFSLGQKFTLFATYSPLSTFDSYTALGLHMGFG